MSLASRKLIQATAGAADAGDDYFANVVLLLDGDGTNGDDNNTFTDSSTNGFTVTENGSVIQGSFSPFTNDEARDITVDGGSGYFAGSGDYLEITDNNDLDFGTGDLTVEFWAYFDEGISNANGIISKGSAGTGWQIIFSDTDKLKFIRTTGSANSPQITSSTSSTTKCQWHHIALTRSGTTVTLWINGVSEGTYTDSTSWDTSDPLRIGTNRGANSDYVGYISDVRLVKGTAVYTSAFTPPTAPLTAITNTSLLLNFQDAGIYDLTGINNVDTVGNAQIDTAVKKYGTGSIEFDETGDYLAVPPTDDIILGTGDFTIEGWLYIGTNPVGNGQGMFQISNGYLNSAVRGPAAGVNNGNGKWAIYYGTSQQTATAAAPSINTWYHVAYVRNSSTTKLYIDGTELISVSDSTNYSDTYLTIGGWYSASYLLNGFIDDFRITKGIARYTSSFTPPDAALPKF